MYLNNIEFKRSLPWVQGIKLLLPDHKSIGLVLAVAMKNSLIASLGNDIIYRLIRWMI